MILILTQCFPPELGGIETLMGGLAAAAARSGAAVRVLADGKPAPEDPSRPYAIERFAGWKPLRRRAKARAARRRLAEAELVIADSWKSLEHLPPRAAIPAARVHCLAHGMEFPRDPGAAKAARIGRAFARADAILANSRWTAEQAARFAGPTPVRVVTPPLDPPPAPDEAARARLAAALGEANPLIATLGRLEPRKGVDRVISAVADLARSHPGLRLAVAGGGPDRERLETLSAELGVADRVAFLGRIDEAEKAALLERADLFAMPARREGDSVEGFGIVYLEAGWFGAPSLAGVEGGAADAVAEGESGLLCDGADQEAVTAALRRLVEDAALRDRLAAGARRHAEAQLWERRLGDYLSAPSAETNG